MDINKHKVLKDFVGEIKNLFGENLVAVVLYASYYLGYAGKGSEYDLFVLFKNPVNEKFKDQLIKKYYPPIDIEYFTTLKELKNHIKSGGGWSSLVVLTQVSEPIYATKEYPQFISELKSIKPEKRAIIKRYKKERNKFDLDFIDIHKLKGFRAAKWVYHSINKRLQILSYLRFSQIDSNFFKNLERNKDILTEEEVVFIKEMRKRLYGRINKMSENETKFGKNLIIKTSRLIEDFKI